MRNEQIFAGIILIVVGGFEAILPKKFFEFKVFIGKKIFGINSQASAKTYKIYRVLGLAFMILGFLILTGRI